MNKGSKKAMRILITGTNTTLDNGESAMSSSAIKSFKKVFPTAEFVIGSTQKKIDAARWRRMLPEESRSFKIVGGTDSARVPRSLRAILVILKYLPEFLLADLCLDISGDGYSDLTQFRVASSR